MTGFYALADVLSQGVSPAHVGQCYAWPVWAPVGLAIVHGRWPVELSPVLRRGGPEASQAPVRPPKKVRRAYLAWVRRNPASQRSARAASGPGEAWRVVAQGCVKRYCADHIVQALRCTRHLHSQRNRAFVQDMLALVLGPQGVASAAREWLEAQCLEVPSRTCLLRARPRLDVAAMALWRNWYAASGPVFRYVAFDASPQRSGLEVFGAAERVIRQCDVGGGGASVEASAVVQRRLPIVSLGQGRASRADKAEAHVHQTFLDYGQCAATFAAAFRDVRQCLSDMGAEFGIGGFADIRAAYLRGELAASAPNDAKGHLFPLALEVPGSQHITDVCLRLALSALDFWPQWQAQAKAACQFLASVNHRDKLRELLRGGQCGQCDVAAAEASLVNSCERFAHWRWGTVRRAASGLMRMEAAVRAVWANGGLPAARGERRDGRRACAGVGQDGFVLVADARCTG
ncbi:MAG: hypothetical protein GY772_30700 [bacterium]|nr:hypothetical protein [bacterium]